ncbi:MAG: GNAT family N-acetyltransferase [Phycisphaerae bacterium]
MNQRSPHDSIASLGPRVGPVAARHIESAFRRLLHGPRVAAEPGYVRLVTGEPHPFGNVAIVSDGSNLAGVQAAIDPLLTCGAPAAVLVPGRVSEAVNECLNAHAFERHEAMPAMAVEIDALAPTGLPEGYALTRVGAGSDGAAWTRAFAAGYELPYGVAEAFSPNAVRATTAPDAPVQFFAVHKDGRMVGTSLVFLADGVAGVYCVSTIPEERGRGLGAHATAEPLRRVHALGYRVGVLQSSPAGHSVYRKLGFADVDEAPLYVRMPDC